MERPRQTQLLWQRHQQGQIIVHMQIPALHQGLETHKSWQDRIVRALDELERWLESHRRATPQARQQIERARTRILAGRLSVAVAAACHRDRVELINTLFFPEHSARLLPEHTESPCPIEILWDAERNESYLRLLPVETRALDVPFSEISSDPRFWVHYPLQVEHPDQASGTLQEIFDTKLVSMREAARLGLSSDGLPPQGQPASGSIRVPKWRYARVSLPHPLLRQGLTVLSAPGIEALGSEPDLTQKLLPSAAAVVFVLAYDEGVSRDDLRVWQHHLKGFQSSRQRATVVALDKVDRAWDTQHDTAKVNAQITEQRRQTAAALGIDQELVVPISARQGLLAKRRKNEALLRRSALPALERQIVLRILDTRHREVGEIITAEVAQLLERNRNRVSSRIVRLKAQLDELEDLIAKTEQVISKLLESTRVEEQRYLDAVERFQNARNGLVAETAQSHRLLDPEQIRSLVDRSMRALGRSWTTPGLNREMRSLFNEMRQTMQTIGSESERIRKLVREIYREFSEEVGIEISKPKVFVSLQYRVEIELLYQELDAFQRRPEAYLASRRSLIARFDERIVSRAMALFEHLRAAHEDWLREALEPLANGIQEHKRTMEGRLETLTRLNESRERMNQRVRSMQDQYVASAQVLTGLRNIQNALQADPAANQGLGRRPQLVSQGAAG